MNDDLCVYSQGRQQALVCRVWRSACPHRRRLSTSVTDWSVWYDFDVWNGRRQRQLSVDDSDASWTACQPHSHELQSTGIDRLIY